MRHILFYFSAGVFISNSPQILWPSFPIKNFIIEQKKRPMTLKYPLPLA